MRKRILLFLFACSLYLFGIVFATENTGVMTLDIVPDVSLQTFHFQPMYVKIVMVENGTETIIWKSFISKSEDINISVPYGDYKLYVRLQGHRTTWELDNNDTLYTISPSNNTVVPLWANEPLFREVIGDAPWRVEPSKDSIPILIMIKDANEGNAYSLDHIEIYTCNYNANGDCINDRYLRNVYYGVEIGNQKYNLYYNGDWYSVYWLPKSGSDINGNPYTLSGKVNFHVGLITPSIWDLDPDAHSYFTVNLAGDALPTLLNWYSGDTHYHTYYSDNNVEFGAPVEAAIEAGKSIGLDWVTLTDHSFDLDDTRSDASNLNDKWNNLTYEYNLYKYNPEFKIILGEEVSVWGTDENKIRHYLVYGMEDFRNVSGTGLNFFPGQADEPGEVGDTWTLDAVIRNTTAQGGVGYGAHPTGDPGFVDGRILQRGPWTIADYNLTGYSGLEAWNGYGNDANRDSGIEEWKKLLQNGRKDIFIAAGTDAHGDLSHQTYLDWPWSGWVEDNENAFGKARTYVYTTDFSNTGILNALRDGHSIATSGPLVTFTINNEIIGNIVQVSSGTKPTLNIKWKSTDEFGSVNRIDIYRNGIKVDSLYPSSLGKSGLDDSYSWTDTTGITSNAYYRLEAFTNLGHRAYTNPIWVEISEVTIGNFTFSDASDSGDSLSDRPYNVQLRISTGSVSSLSVANVSIAQISESASVINGSTGEGKQVDKTRSYPAEKSGYVANGTDRSKNVSIQNVTELVGYVAPGTKVENKTLNITGYVAPGVEVNKTRGNATGNVTAQILCTNSYIYNTWVRNELTATAMDITRALTLKLTQI